MSGKQGRDRFSHLLEATQSINGQGRTGPVVVFQVHDQSPTAKTANSRQEKAGLNGDEHMGLCSSASFLGLVHKAEDNSIKVGNDFALCH